MPDAHASAVIDPSAVLAHDVRVGPYVVIEAGVEVGEGSVLHVGTVLRRGSRLGARCQLGPYATVGGPPMDRDYQGEDSYAVLEEEVELREFASVHRATGHGAETRVGAGTLVMPGAHVSHNVRVGRNAVLTNAVLLGGHTQVGDNAVIGGGVLVHQYTRIGALAMVGGGSAVNRDVLPYTLAHGYGARHYRLNRVGLNRHGVDGDRYAALEGAFRAVRNRDEARLATLAESWPDVAHLRDFRAESARGVARFLGR